MPRRAKKYPNRRETKDERKARDNDSLDPYRIWTDDVMCLRASNNALVNFQGPGEHKSLPSSDESTLLDKVVNWLKCESLLHTMHSAYLNVVATQSAQLLKMKTAGEMESDNINMLARLSSIQEAVEAYWGPVDLFREAYDRLATKEANLSRWRRDAFTFKKQISTIGTSARKKFERVEEDVEKAFDDLQELCSWYSDGMQFVDYVGGDAWTETEERRLRSALYFFGRNWKRVAEYVRLKRIVARPTVQDPKLKSKVQKFLVLYRKCALPLPPSVLSHGEEYTLKGIDPLEIESQLWVKIIVDVQYMLPIEDVPFGRRAYRTPNEPIFCNVEE